MMHYYNEFNPEAAAMLRQFMKDGLIPHGDVDERSITEVTPDDVKGYTQCHFFAGIAGWQFALQQAGWEADRPVWTGSCPCQPFSSAGRHKGQEDERHLWPAWERLISECRPPVIFGEQVAKSITHGWLDDVYEMLEEKDYAVGSSVLPASAVGAPHKRERLWFVADARCQSKRDTKLRPSGKRQHGEAQGQRSAQGDGSADGSIMGNTQHNGQPTTTQQGSNRASVQHDTQGQDGTSELKGAGCASDVADPSQQQSSRYDSKTCFEKQRELGRKCGNGNFWGDSQWIHCPDGKERPIKRGVPLLAHGVQHRKPILHAIGNAIVPQVAAEFIGAYMDTRCSMGKE